MLEVGNIYIYIYIYIQLRNRESISIFDYKFIHPSDGLARSTESIDIIIIIIIWNMKVTIVPIVIGAFGTY